MVITFTLTPHSDYTFCIQYTVIMVFPFTGKNVLMNEYGFSKFYINPTFEDVDISLYM